MKTMHESAAALYPSALAATLAVASASPSAALGLDGLKVRTPALVTGLVLTLVAQSALRGVLAPAREALGRLWLVPGGAARLFGLID